ncbi:tRNA (adenine-N(1)-)-methyltransferase catalytic subunit trm61 [Lobulomyces angularis]|nr:tRNA (adenine-N(1)-)-methyltransferase catalytic subunit trm61 [Lobulomyces angularis]
MLSNNETGFVYLLKPTPELWTEVLPHRTQILYFADISFISMMLDLKPGVKFIEAGTGSGSFSHAIARSIQPNGHLYTFEYHKERFLKAFEEFELHNLQDIITVEHRDVCKDGLKLKNAVTAVFLDLPAPWEAIQSAKEAMKEDRVGRICCFSPCIEQVQLTVKELEKQGATDIKMYETLIKPYLVKVHQQQLIEEGYVRYNKHSLKNNKYKQIDLKRKLDELKKNGDEEDYSSDSNLTASDSNLISQEKPFLVSYPKTNVRGHTSYLTFAKFLPTI